MASAGNTAGAAILIKGPR